jgi:hypothetical protein
MAGMLVGGSAIVGLVAGIAGFMINDLGKERAIQAALNQMYSVLSESMKKFATAEAALKAAIEKVQDTDNFKSDIARIVAKDGVLHAALVAPVSNVLIKDHADKLRGPAGTSPTVQEVAEELVKNHADKLRGGPGPSPAVQAVAEELIKHHADKLRGGPGPSPSVQEVAEELIKHHADKLRGGAWPKSQRAGGRRGVGQAPCRQASWRAWPKSQRACGRRGVGKELHR